MPRRRADAARNDELFLDSGVDLLRERGPDRLAALDLARSAGLTTGAVYARYENVEEILVGLWQNRIATPMRMFLENAVEALTPGPRRARAGAMALKALANPSGPLRPGISLLIAAPRVPELAEVVGPDVTSWAAELGLSGDPHDPTTAHRTALIASALGCLYFSTADMFDVDDWHFATELADDMMSNESRLEFPLPDPIAPPPIEVSTGHPARDALVNGAARVIARGGMERATTQRIARAAGLTPTDLFAEYRTREELFADVASKLLKHIYETARLRTPEMISASAQLATSIDDPRLVAWHRIHLTSQVAEYRGLLQPEFHEHRRLRLEFHLAAIHDPLIRATLRNVDRSTNETLSLRASQQFGLDPRSVQRLIRSTRMMGQGSMLIQELTGLLSRLDLRHIFEPLSDKALRDSIAA